MITIESSWGTVYTDDYGNVTERDLYDGEENYLEQVVKFDIDEFESWYLAKFGKEAKWDSFDVLELGFWRKDGTYCPADSGWRNEMILKPNI